MFARDDAHRGRRSTLLWVFGPLVLGALIVTGLAVVKHLYPGGGLTDAPAPEGDCRSPGDEATRL